MIFYLKLFLLLFLSIKLAESSVESFNESYLELQRSFQIILQDGQIDNNCTLRNSRGQIEKNFHNLTWIWLLNDTIIIDKTNKLEIKTNEFSTRIFKKAVEFSDTGNYVCKVKYFEKNEKEISFDLMVIDKLYAVWIFLGSASLCAVICVAILIYEAIAKRKRSSPNRKADETYVQS